MVVVALHQLMQAKIDNCLRSLVYQRRVYVTTYRAAAESVPNPSWKREVLLPHRRGGPPGGGRGDSTAETRAKFRTLGR